MTSAHHRSGRPPGAVLPGFVDLQVNGCLGVDFSSPDLSEEACLATFREIVRRGTALFLPTVVTAPREVYRRNIPLILACARRPEFAARVPGLHLEGPFLSREPGAHGAHNPAWMPGADPGYLDELLGLAGGRIRLLTVAAELPGMDALVRRAVAAGVTVSLGHHLAGADALGRAAAAGARALTHLGNGLPGLLPRHPNPIWDGLACDDLAAMIITDGHHLPPAVIKTVLRAKGVECVVVTSDASPLAGLPPGRYAAFGAEAVIDPDGRLYNPKAGNLAGSSRFLLECMNHLASLRLLDEAGLVRVGLDNPLALVGLDRSALDGLPPACVFQDGAFVST